MGKNGHRVIRILTRVICFLIAAVMFAGFFTGCGKKQNKTVQTKQAKASNVSSGGQTCPDDMIIYDDADFEFFYPRAWANMLKQKDDNSIALYDKDDNYVGFAFENMEYSSIDEAVRQYKSAAVVSFEESKTNMGETLYLAENSIAKGINFTAYVFANNKQYELRAWMTYDFYNKNIELVKRVAKTIHIRDRNGAGASTTQIQQSTQSQQSGTEASCSMSSKLKAEFQALEQKNIGTKNFVKTSTIENKLLFDGGGTFTYNVDTLYTAAYTLLSGLTSGNKDILKQCMYAPENGMATLTDAVPIFASDTVAPYSGDFKIYIMYDNRVHIDFKSPKDDMQFNIKFDKIAGKYYFNSFIQK